MPGWAMMELFATTTLYHAVPPAISASVAFQSPLKPRGKPAGTVACRAATPAAASAGAGAAHLAALPVLSSLNLSNTSVGAGATVSLGQITSLSSLALLGCPIPPSHAAALRAALPRLLVLELDRQSGFAARQHQHDPAADAAEIAAFEVPW